MAKVCKTGRVNNLRYLAGNKTSNVITAPTAAATAATLEATPVDQGQASALDAEHPMAFP